ncbi:MAG: hypothetical protein KF784_11110 [Fimbriimonadaceae bacterium]|nr:hypothetical protein [Fimbriimonadaceae bacterium]
MKLGQRIHNMTDIGRRISLGHLKRCPVCGTVNSTQTHECVMCRWHGEFDHDHESIEMGLTELFDKCPDLAEVVLTIPTKRKRRGLVSWFGMLRWILRGRIDLKV